jgi:preprotein translocase subunit SecG
MKKTVWLITLIILLVGLVFSQEVKNGQYGGLGGGGFAF